MQARVESSAFAGFYFKISQVNLISLFKLRLKIPQKELCAQSYVKFRDDFCSGNSICKIPLQSHICTNFYDEIHLHSSATNSNHTYKILQ